MSTEQERAAFEALAKEQGWELDKYPGSVGAYVEPDTAAAWLAYRAALAAAPVQAVPEFSDAAWALAQKVRADLDRQSCPGVYMDIAMESIARNLAAAPVQAVPDTWSVYVAGMIGGYLGWGVDDERIQAVAGIIERRRWAATAAPQVPAVPVRDAGPRLEEGLRAIAQRLGHIYWGAGEAECPDEIKAPNGELFKVRCKKCGQDNPSSKWCAVDASPTAAPQPAERVPLTDEQIEDLIEVENELAEAVTPEGAFIAGIRAAEREHGIRAAGVKEPGNAVFSSERSESAAKQG